MNDARAGTVTNHGRELYGGQSREQREADRRARITEAAVHLFATQDYSDVTVADICARAKVSKRHFYDHFADRADLLTALHRELNDWLLTQVTTAAPRQASSPADFFLPVMQALVRILREHPDRARVVYINAPRMELRRRGVLRAEAEMLGRMVRPMLGAIPDDTLFDRAMLALIAGLSENLIAWVADGLTAPPDALAEHLSRIAVSMLEGLTGVR